MARTIIPNIKCINFKASLASDHFSSEDVIDLVVVLRGLDAFRDALDALKIFVKKGLCPDNLAGVLLEFPRLYGILCAFLSIHAAVELSDGRKLSAPGSPPRDLPSATSAAEILLELGLSVLLTPKADVDSLFILIQIASDAARRRFRVETRIKRRIQTAVETAISTAKTSEFDFAVGSKTLLPVTDRGIIEYVVTVNGRAAFAIASTFQAHSGGRQNREIRITYPALHARLASVGISLILIADGEGMRGLSSRVLNELFTAVPHTMTVSQAETGGLLNSFAAIPEVPVPVSVDSAGVSKIIGSALEVSLSVQASLLPVGNSTARLALASYASRNSHLNLDLAEGGTALVWRNSALVERFRKSKIHFDGEDAIDGFMSLIGAHSEVDRIRSLDFSSRVAALSGDQVFSTNFVVCARPGSVNAEALREVAKHSLQSTPESRVAVLITQESVEPTKAKELRDVQSFLPVTVVVIDLGVCLQFAQANEPPRDRMGKLLLEQTDLTKLSPFVVRGVTPARVFFGREEEEATLLSTLATNSVALLGGRRIGKTSLMRHSFARLTAANLRPYFGDCQVVRTWADFGVMATRNWKVNLPADFKPQHLFDLVAQLGADSDRPTVILLDEIDQLLEWDRFHSNDEVPEAFFRACRSISQQGLAQFVFSGERTIANRLWDASSPHWNFCRPLMLQQLRLSAANSLIAEPLEALGIRIDHRDEFLDACWSSTDGHPELLQFLGDKIVAAVNERDRKDVFAHPDDVTRITGQFEFAEQYLETYWGQATAEERVLSILLMDGPQSLDEIRRRFDVLTPGGQVHDVQGAFRMLELYGIAQPSTVGYELRTHWFTSALTAYGGADVAIKRYAGESKL